MRADYGGIVYIQAEYAYGGEPPIDGHWEPGEAEDFVYGPGWSNAADAIAWGRHRAPWVILRVELEVHTWRYAWVDGLPIRLPAPIDHRTVQYSAGEAHRDYEEEYVRWPTASDRRDDVVADGYRGAVWLVQGAVGWAPGELVGYTARWETEHEGRLRPKAVAGPWSDELHEAFAWARERAPYVLVHEPGAGYESAGVRHLAGLDIPRIDAFYEPDPTPLPDGPFEVTIEFGEPWTPKSFPIPEGLEPAGGLPET